MSGKPLHGAKRAFETEAIPLADEGNPSEVSHAAFIGATYHGDSPMPEDKNVGKWLFFVAEKYVDDTWANVKKAVENGKLWRSAKVSTAWRSKGGPYVICVYTYDYNDEDDVMRIREHLREMGFKRTVSYKSDEQTAAGMYSDNTEGIALYRA